MNKTTKGFSLLEREQKTDLTARLTKDAAATKALLETYRHSDKTRQGLHDGFSENTLSNYYLPWGIAPNFLIDAKVYHVPMVTEESSVVAAAAKSASFWAERGGFCTKVVSTVKTGQVYLDFDGGFDVLKAFFDSVKPGLEAILEPLSENMRKRGGGILGMELLDKTALLENYYQINVRFDTVDSMGANFINTSLEAVADAFEEAFMQSESARSHRLEITMSILSNYTPECLVQARVSAPVSEMVQKDMPGEEFCRKFVRAVDIAWTDPQRATTHNKGIMNGVDAVVIATGNDFRAVEAAAHAYAAKDGTYRSLSYAEVHDGLFSFSLELPMAIGTIGGLTALHPLARLSLDVLGITNAQQLMSVVAAVGLAQNFGAVRSLVTTGIQKGHMKMHLGNIAATLGADQAETTLLKDFFRGKIVSYTSVEQALKKLRNKK